MTEPREAKTILLAEDDADDRMLALQAIKRSHSSNEVKVVEDGEELMDYLHRRGSYADTEATPTPDLILLDLNMPRKSGREALQEIKSDPEFCRIPVVVLTTSGADVDVVQSYTNGVNAYIVKPVTFSDLAEAIQAVDSFWFDVAELPSSRA